MVWTAAALVFAVALGIAWIIDRPVAAPAWLQARIEERIETRLFPGSDLQFGAMRLTVHHGWRPQILLRDAALIDASGLELAALSQVQASLALRPLLRGQVQPKRIALEGGFATLRRNPDGSFALITGEALTARAAGTLPELIEQLDATLLSPDLAALTTVDMQALTLRYDDLRAGIAWTVDGARLRAERDGDMLSARADIALLSGGAGVAIVQARYDSRLGDTAAQFGATMTDISARDIATQSPAFAWLSALDAPISGALRAGVDADGALTPVNATLSIGAGAVRPTGATRPIPFTSARSYFRYDPATETLRFDELAVDSEWVRGTAEGTAQLVGAENGQLRELVAQVRLADLSLDPPGVWSDGLSLAGAQADFRLIPDPFRVDLGQLRLRDGADALMLDGFIEAAPDGWSVALDGRMEEAGADRILGFWPEGAVPNTRAWVAGNLSEGQLHDVSFGLRAGPGEDVEPYFDFGFSGATVRYLRTLPPITDASGRGSLMRNRFALSVDRGRVDAGNAGPVDVSGSSFIVPDVTVRGGAPAIVRLRTDSSVTALMTLLADKPVQALRGTDLPASLAQGRAEMEATLSLPLVRDVRTEDVTFEVEGVLREVRSDMLVDGRAVEADRLTVVADNAAVRIAGPGVIDGVPIDVTWTQPLDQPGSTLQGTVAISDAALRRLGVRLPPGSVSGAGLGDITVTLGGAVPRFRLVSSLRGVGLSVPQLGWAKPRGAAARFEVAGTLGATPAIEAIKLDAAGLDAVGTVRLRPGGALDRVRFSRLRVGGWLDVAADLIGRGPGVPPAVLVRGGQADLTRASLGGNGQGGGTPLTINLDRLQVTNAIALAPFTGDFRSGRALSGSFAGNVNGRATVTGEARPTASGRSAFTITGADAGRAAAAAGVLNQARGGAMTLRLLPVGPTSWDAQLDVQNTRVRDAPAIAALLNAVSVVGLLEQMNGSGIHFAEVDAAFRIAPDRVTITRASATGPSIGISIDGYYTAADGALDLQGVFSPLYMLNGVGSLVTGKGEGLIGMNFTLKGPAEDPRVQVNPLSALTPSFLREVFRRPAPQVEGVPDPEIATDTGQRALLPEAGEAAGPGADASSQEALSGGER